MDGGRRSSNESCTSPGQQQSVSEQPLRRSRSPSLAFAGSRRTSHTPDPISSWHAGTVGQARRHGRSGTPARSVRHAGGLWGGLTLGEHHGTPPLKTRDRHAWRGAGDVVHTDGYQPAYRYRVTRVLAAHSQTQVWARPTSLLHRDADQPSDTDVIQRHEGVHIQEPGLAVLGQERALGVVTRHAPRGCLLYTSPSPRDGLLSRMPSSA